MSDSEILMVYVTCTDEREAGNIAADLLSRGLIACANVLPSHRAYYYWNERVRDEEETGLILKTTKNRFSEAEEIICRLSRNDCPCIVAWPVTIGHAPFMEWVATQTVGKDQ